MLMDYEALKQEHTKRINVAKSYKHVLSPLCILCGKRRKTFKEKWIELSNCETYEAVQSRRKAAKGLNDEIRTGCFISLFRIIFLILDIVEKSNGEKNLTSMFNLIL